jgi:hypothetical protein
MNSAEKKEVLDWLGLLLIVALLFKLGGDLAFWAGHSSGYSEPLPTQPTCGEA